MPENHRGNLQIGNQKENVSYTILTTSQNNFPSAEPGYAAALGHFGIQAGVETRSTEHSGKLQRQGIMSAGFQMSRQYAMTYPTSVLLETHLKMR